jgi:hypothetical protein
VVNERRRFEKHVKIIIAISIFELASAAGRSSPNISSHVHSENAESINMERTLAECLPATTGSQKLDLDHT